jgi:hypothetical protein
MSPSEFEKEFAEEKIPPTVGSADLTTATGILRHLCCLKLIQAKELFTMHSANPTEATDNLRRAEKLQRDIGALRSAILTLEETQ